VASIGGDFDTTFGRSITSKYRINAPLVQNSYISVTLAWDREVDGDNGVPGNRLTEGNSLFDAEVFLDAGVSPYFGGPEANNGQWDYFDWGNDGRRNTGDEDGSEGNRRHDRFEPSELFFDANFSRTWEPDVYETFSVVGFADLDLYLLPAGATDLGQAVAQSISTDYTVEHIFHQVPQTGNYEIWVHHQSGDVNVAGQDYALAWWGVPVPEPGTLALASPGLVMLLLLFARRVSPSKPEGG
jgi:hypothetical protein